jgi:hypothetical protein
MSSISSTNYIAPVRFHQIREGEDLSSVATKYQVDLGRIARENPGIGKPGDMVVIHFAESRAA